MDDKNKAVETESITVDGRPVTIEKSLDNTIAVRLPEGLSDDEKEKFIRQVETGSKLVGSLYRKHQTANEREQALLAKEKELAEREASLSNGAADPTHTDEPEPLWKRLGLSSESDEDDYAADNPAAYRKALTEYTREIATMDARKEAQRQAEQIQQTLQQHSLTQKIAAAGNDPEDVQRFAKHYGMPMSENTYELYVRANQAKTDPVIDAMIEAQRKQVRWIDPGDQASISGLINKARKNPDALSSQEVEQLIAAARQANSE